MAHSPSNQNQAGGVNQDLVKERQAATFNIEELTYIWDGSKEQSLRRRYIENLVFSDNELSGPDDRLATRDQNYSEYVRRHILAWKKMKQYNLTSDIDRSMFLLLTMGNQTSGLMMHDIAFVPMLRLQASDEQLQKWLPMIDNQQMLGCYAQTELGHGTFVRGLQTTATYDATRKQFVINTPSLEATKWWVGSAGLSSNYAVLLAQLYTNGTCHGINAFLVQLRDTKTFKVLPGVTVGDIGPKFGFEAIDNGFIRFDNVRIPREHMLMRHSQVLEDGTYIKPTNEKIIYGGMLSLRGNIPLGSTLQLSQAVTIAIRYSCVRRQSELKPNERESQVLDYQTQQHKLLPLLALTYAYRFSGQMLSNMMGDVMSEVRAENYTRLIEAHALASGLKAVMTTRGSWSIELCRLACGGHGYSQASNLPLLFTAAAGPATAEGEATILLLQTARYLLKNFVQARANKRIDLYTTYLDPSKAKTSVTLTDANDVTSLLTAYELRAARLVQQAAIKLQPLVLEKGLSQEEAINACSVLLVKCAVAHVEYVILRTFIERVEMLQCSPPLRRVLQTLCLLHATHGITQNAGDFMQDGCLTDIQLDAVYDVMFHTYDVIRRDAVALVDAFNLDDRVLRSSLGRYDGRVYESLYEWAKQSPLNQTQVHESFGKYMKALQSSSTAKL